MEIIGVYNFKGLMILHCGSIHLFTGAVLGPLTYNVENGLHSCSGFHPSESLAQTQQTDLESNKSH